MILRPDADGILYSRDCDCQIARRNALRIKKSGLETQLKEKTFDRFQTSYDWQKPVKEKALDYVKNGGNSWLVITGGSGSGKTHLATAVVGELIKSNHEVLYIRWREVAPRLTALVNDRPSYEQEMNKLKEIPALYIDDFWKGGATPGDIKLAFELINSRYDSRLQTIITCEMNIAEMLAVDEAIGGRIYERSSGYCINTPNDNWRLRAKK